MRSRLSEKSLENIALYYLQRFSSSVENLRRVLIRRVDRKLRLRGAEAPRDPDETRRARDEALGWVDALLEKLKRGGLLDDARYARMTAESLARRGQSLRKVRFKLRSKGLDSEGVEEGAKAVVQASGEGEPDGAAVLAYAKRRRLGPYRRAPADEARRQKELAALARAGFPYGLARRVVEAESVEALEGDIVSGGPFDPV